MCYDDKIATYSYGPIGGKPDLFLSEAIARVDFEPWSGVGKAIAESVSFYNGDYSYEVVGGFDRPFSEEEMLFENRQFGWLDVARNGKSLGRLECVPETVSYGFGSGIYDAKVAAGLEWDDRSQTWAPDQNHPNRAPILQEDERNGAIEDCLPATEFELGGIAMGDTVDALGKLGTPEATGES